MLAFALFTALDVSSISVSSELSFATFLKPVITFQLVFLHERQFCTNRISKVIERMS